MTAIAYRGGRQENRSTLASLEGAPSIVARPDRAVLVSRDDLSFIEITVEDAAGVVAVEDRTPIRVRVDGAGELVAFGTGQPDSLERFDASIRTPFGGRLLAIVRPTGTGTIVVTVTVTGDDLAPAMIEIVAENAARNSHTEPAPAP